MKISLIIGFWTLLLTGAASAQQPATAPPASSDVRISALEQQVSALKSEVEELKAALTAAAPAPAAAEPAPVPQAAPPPAPAEVVSTQGGQIPVYGGATGLAKALNPDISVIGDFLGAVGGNPIRPVPALEMHETEVAFQSVIDPYARADFFISFGESGVNLEEGYITFTSLPAGFVARAGKMRAAFGKVNTLHNHVLPWTDRPLVTRNLVGGEDGINDAVVHGRRDAVNPARTGTKAAAHYTLSVPAGGSSSIRPSASDVRSSAVRASDANAIRPGS